jgi:hypothetical protein
MYVGALMLVMVGASLLSGVRFGRGSLLAAGAVTAFAVGANLSLLLEGHERLEAESVLTKADLAALEIAAPELEPTFWLEPTTAGTTALINVSAGPYLSMVDEHGSPAYTPAELATAPQPGRFQADVVLSAALPLAARPGRGEAGPPQSCRPLGSVAPQEVSLPPGSTTIRTRPGGSATLLLRRFSGRGAYPAALQAPAGAATRLRIPPDLSSRRWHLWVQSGLAARVCSPRG